MMGYRLTMTIQRSFPAFLTAVLLAATLPSLAAEWRIPATSSGSVSASRGMPGAAPRQDTQTDAIARYEGKLVQAIQLPGVIERDRGHLLELLPQKAGEPLDRERVRDSLRTLYSTGRFADIQAEIAPSGDEVVLTFTTSANFFIGAVDVEGAPNRPTSNQIVNGSKFQLGERYTQDKLDRALENIRRLMQEGGYYRARVTAESTSNPDTQQVDLLFHITPGVAAHVGEVNVTGTSDLSSAQVQSIAHMDAGDRITATSVSDALQRLRKRFQKQNRALAQVSVAEQNYHPETNAVDFTFQIDPGPVVEISAQGYHISRGVLKREIPVYEENAVDDDLLSEGKSNLLDYLQTRGHFDAKVAIRKEFDPKTMRVIYDIDPGPVHKLVLVEITGSKNFMSAKDLLERMEIQPATDFSHGRYSGILLKGDVATIEGLYRSNGYRQVHIEAKVDDDYRGKPNQLAVHLHIQEGAQTQIGELTVVGNERIPTSEFPELSTKPGQPYSEQELANDRERILNYYFNNGFPNAALDITSQESASQPNREDVTFTIHEGERFTVNRVMAAGTEHTRDYVVEREVQVQERQPLSQKALLDTQTRLYNLGIFSQVDTAVQNPEGTDPQKNVLVQMQEAKRYTFTYGLGLELQTGQPSGQSASQGATGVSPRVEFDVTRLNFGGRDQTVAFQSHVGSLQQRGLISYTVPKLLNSDKWKLIYTIFYDNSLDVATFTSQRLEGKIDLHQQVGRVGTGEPDSRPGPSSLDYRFEFRRVKASHFAKDFDPNLIPLESATARIGGPGFTFIRDKRDNPLESTEGNYFTLDGFASSSYFGSQADFGRALAQNSTYQAFGRKWKSGQRFVFARSTTIGLQQLVRGTRILAPGACLPIPNPCPSSISLVPLPELFFAGGGNSHRGFGLNQAGPRDPASGFPVGGTALFVNSLELRFPETSLPYLGEGFGLAIFHDMGNVFTAPHDMLKGLMRWHQPDPQQCLSGGTTNQQCYNQFNNSGYDYTSHALGVGVRYKTPIGPLRFDFGYNLNPTSYFQVFKVPVLFGAPQNVQETQRLRHFNVFFSIGQPF